jgi:hypothetical protein
MDHFDESLWKAKLASKTSKSTKEKKSPVNVSQACQIVSSCRTYVGTKPQNFSSTM